MNTKDTQTPPENKDSEALRKRDMKRFIFVMVVFTIGMAFMLFFEVSAWWIWYIYFAIWTLIEYRIAKSIKLKWWHWAIIIAVILLIDWVVLELIAYIKA